MWDVYQYVNFNIWKDLVSKNSSRNPLFNEYERNNPLKRKRFGLRYYLSRYILLNKADIGFNEYKGCSYAIR